MPWQDRVREAAYTSPSGVRHVFDYEDVRQTIEKRTTGFEFPDANGTFVQDLGHSGRRYPLRVFIWGEDYDLVAAEFEAALIERGVGKLEHPIYGTFDVVPFGTITRRDDLKTRGNQAVIDVTFWETTRLIFPTSQVDPGSEVLSAVDDYGAAVAEEFEEVTSLESAVDQADAKNVYESLLASTTTVLQVIADTQDNVRDRFNVIHDSINFGIDVLIGQPLTLALETVQLIQLPGRALTNISARLSAYGDLLNNLVSTGTAARNSNEYHINELYASTEVSGSVVSVVNNQFEIKTAAIEAAEIVLAQMDILTAWRDDNYEALSEIDTGGSYQQLLLAVSLAAGFLVEISFELRQERKVVLDRPRTIIDLVAEFYGTVDDELDFFISTNDLSGSEVLEVPRGREVVFYV